MGHRHNAVVNSHRSNALRTYDALVEAGVDPHIRGAVLVKAAECIYAPLPSGFSKSDGGEGGTMSVVSLVPGLARGLGGQGSASAGG
jgi:hypothetical protein